jgi:hypothetical protein
MAAEENGFVAEFGDIPVSLAAHSDCPFATTHLRGELEPKAQGWISRSYREIEPNDAIGVVAEGTDVTLVSAMALGARRPAEIRSASRGATDLRLRAHGDVWAIKVDSGRHTAVERV